jgi:O-6-methylguanine DNA methyltransferase
MFKFMRTETICPHLLFSDIIKHMSGFSKKVYKIVKKIPKGEVLTYKQVAKRAGNPRAARAVGNILNKNHNQDIPCHRVIRSDGWLGGYNRGEKIKKKILEKEGIMLRH